MEATATILGSGGFERNLEMREKYQPHPTSVDWTTGSQFNTGGGMLAGIAAGAETDLLDSSGFQLVRDSVENEQTVNTLMAACDQVYHLASAVGVQLACMRWHSRPAGVTAVYAHM